MAQHVFSAGAGDYAFTIDSAGNVFGARFNGAVSDDIYRWAVATYTSPSLYASGLQFLSGLTFDKSGNLYVGGSTVYKVIDTGTSWAVTWTPVKTQLATGFNQTEGVAVDSVGNIFVSDQVGALSHLSRQTGGDLYRLSSSATPEPSAWLPGAGGIVCIPGARMRRRRSGILTV